MAIKWFEGFETGDALGDVGRQPGAIETTRHFKVGVCLENGAYPGGLMQELCWQSEKDPWWDDPDCYGRLDHVSALHHLLAWGRENTIIYSDAGHNLQQPLLSVG